MSRGGRPRQNDRCFRCGRPGHHAATCRSHRPAPGPNPGPLHAATNRPARPQATAAPGRQFATTASVRTAVAGHAAAHAANVAAADSAENLVGGIAFIGTALRGFMASAAAAATRDAATSRRQASTASRPPASRPRGPAHHGPPALPAPPPAPEDAMSWAGQQGNTVLPWLAGLPHPHQDPAHQPDPFGRAITIASTTPAPTPQPPAPAPQPPAPTPQPLAPTPDAPAPPAEDAAQDAAQAAGAWAGTEDGMVMDGWMVCRDLGLRGGAKKRKKKGYSTPKKIKHKRKKTKLAVLKYYKADGDDKIERLRRECPQQDCGAGVFIAAMHNRQ
ncbi:ubiquitin-40S ribosomal protein S27a [Exophiala xenobiotica]|uniref:Ubiquitin-40S ribosomal protein S27a n=1 Tax=Lithohypha guttulata TaxID=1690604 RepID=A0ABR0KEN5_9EURO|nr:ubiquitin-40S ribosomal protein S27a [Lithohypha guttulata]KAK5321519.1 ubiquitin-40S ribosomal protein S27a [Exophiala xenobiotica]